MQWNFNASGEECCSRSALLRASYVYVEMGTCRTTPKLVAPSSKTSNNEANTGWIHFCSPNAPKALGCLR